MIPLFRFLLSKTTKQISLPVNFNEQLSLDFSIPSLFVLCILTRWYSLFKVQQSHIITSTQTCQETEVIKKGLTSIYLRSQKASCSKLIDLLTM